MIKSFKTCLGKMWSEWSGNCYTELRPKGKTEKIALFNDKSYLMDVNVSSYTFKVESVGIW